MMGFKERTLQEIGQASIREEPPGHEPALVETTWAVGRLTEEALERLSVFLSDLANRHPLSGPAWYGHRMVITALEADIRRELAAREAEKGEDADGVIH